MNTQNIYTPEKAAQLVGCTEDEILQYVRSGQLKASFLENTGGYVISHNDLVSFLKATRDFKTVSKLFTRRIMIVDRNPEVQDLMRMELGRQGFEIKVATTEREVNFLADDFQPDVICVHLGATMREKDSVNQSLARARRTHKSFLILYHNYGASATMAPKVQTQINTVKADHVVVLDRGYSPLLDAVRARFGLRPTQSRRPPGV